MSRSQRPVWLGEDKRGWDHVRVHVQLLRDPQFREVRATDGSAVHKSVILAVYVGIAAHAELHTGDAFPAQATLAGYAGCSTKTVQRAVEVLASCGYLEVEDRPGLASIYRLLPPPTLDVGTDVGEEGSDVGTDHPRRGDGPTPDVGTDEQEPVKQEPPNETLFAPDSERLCVLLADLIEENGSKRPEISKSWLRAADLMLRKDCRDPAKAERLIRWCQADGFWRSNVMSMPTFREKYDQLRLKANEGRVNGNGHSPRVNPSAVWEGQQSRVLTPDEI